MIGVLLALVAALSWAGSSAILKVLSLRIEPLSLNMLRLLVGTVLLLGFLVISGRGPDLLQTPLMPVIYITASCVIALVIGDPIYIKALSMFDVSRVYPLAICSFPVFTMNLAISFLGETIT